MKKSLIALAALAATGAFAQSSVTLSGNIDFAGASVGGTQALAKGTTFSTGAGTASTSVINIRAVEDFGNGLKVTGHYGLDPRSLANDSLGVTNNTTNIASVAVANNATAAAQGKAPGVVATGLARDEVFVGIESAIGNVRLGAPNSIGLNSFQVSSTLGTGVGSGYTGGGTAGTMTNSFVNTRYNRSIRWDSPVMSGFQAAVLYAPGNDQPAVIASNAATQLLIPDARKATEIGLRYDNGPLSVSYANVSIAKQTNATGWYSSATLANSVKTSTDMLNVRYALGATTVYAGLFKGELLTSTTTATETSGYRVAGKQTIGAIDLMAQYTEQKSGTTDIKSTVAGLRADYNLSKTAAIYAGYEKWDTGVAYNNSLSTGTRTIGSVGLKKQF